MLRGWRYRAASAVGTTAIAMLAFLLSVTVAEATGHAGPVDGTDRLLGALTTGLVVTVALEPMTRPRPRRATATLRTTIGRVVLACLAIGILGATVTPPTRSLATLVLICLLLSLALAPFYRALRRRDGPDRILVVGDDRSRLVDVAAHLPVDPLGYVCPQLNDVPPEAGRHSETSDRHLETSDQHPETSGPLTGTNGRRSGASGPLSGTSGRRSEVSGRQSGTSDRPSGTSTRQSGTSDRPSDAGSRPSSEVRARSDGGPRATQSADAWPSPDPAVVDGIDRLGGLSRLESLLVDRDVDAVALAFAAPDRGECFGALGAAHDRGVEVLAHEAHADHLLVREALDGPLVAVDVEPWPWYTLVAKRAFDVAFAAAGLLALAPVVAVISAAIKLDSSGRVFYDQIRTAEFGGRFRVLKFRTMVPESEDPTPEEDGENERITGVGAVLRKTHLDEIPQLWAVLRGDMSVVGPRAAWIDEERLLEADVEGWRARWHVKPGLTGLAQVNDVTSTAGRRKLRYDLAYIRNHTFRLDLRIVAAQLGIVLTDIGTLVRDHLRHRAA